MRGVIIDEQVDVSDEAMRTAAFWKDRQAAMRAEVVEYYEDLQRGVIDDIRSGKLTKELFEHIKEDGKWEEE